MTVIFSILFYAYSTYRDNPLVFFDGDYSEKVGLVYAIHDSTIMVIPFYPDQLRRMNGRWCIVNDNHTTFNLANYEDFTEDKVILHPSLFGEFVPDPRGVQPKTISPLDSTE